MNLGLLWDSRYAAEAWMETHIPPGAVVGTNGEGVYLPRLPVGLVGVRVEVTPTGLDVADDGPDFLVLSDAYYARSLRKPDLRPVVERLLAGDLGYEPVGSFQQPYVPASALIPTVNPRIVILKKRPTATG
jgi:hypothetical protein